mmetsp:Transcript_16168/g.46435  ORF Transcript_16168/g.46435 Transcript_16168/m.46435 type:complete len:326 (-) Transcript_16168:1219-2196(-)
MAATRPADAVEAAMQSSSTERGHRLGNYHNYYYHHPPSNRIDVLEEAGLIDCIARRLLQHCDETNARKRQKIDDEEKLSQASGTNSSTTSWKYCDLGCNEGNLTISFADAVLKRCHKLSGGDDGPQGTEMKMKCLGLDIDPTLIERATTKFDSSSESKQDIHSGIDARFEACNLCDEAQQLSKYIAFLENDSEVQRFDLTTLFSTTMWIHIHAGDKGLRDFLQRTCDRTELLVVEPQISKCYGKANTRLRKMNRPELDLVTSQSLSMRGNIEEEVEKIILACGFRRLTSEEKEGSDKVNSGSDHAKQAAKRTAWKRLIQVYVRDQ